MKDLIISAFVSYEAYKLPIWEFDNVAQRIAMIAYVFLATLLMIGWIETKWDHRKHRTKKQTHIVTYDIDEKRITDIRRA